MAFNSAGQLTPNFKTWDHQGNLMPNVEYSEGTRPHGEFKPADWLPVQFFDKYFEDYIVITPGKLLAFDNDGRVVPAQYATSSVNIVYTANDVAAGVIDVRSGSAVTAPATFAVSAVTAFRGATGVALAVSKPVGVAPFSFKQWAGGDGSNPANFRQFNYNMQHQVTILCDYVLTLPLVPGAVSAESLPLANWSAAAGTNQWKVTLANKPVAKNTVRSPISMGGTDTTAVTGLLNEVSTVALIKAAGDWNMDYVNGVLTVFALVKPGTAVNDITLTYSTYNTAPSTVSVFAAAVSNLKPGDFVKCDANSNFTKALTNDPFEDVMGQVLEVILFPRDALDKVKTAYSPALNLSAAGSLPGYTGQMDQLPGSATGGVNDAIQFSGAADRMVTINLISR